MTYEVHAEGKVAALREQLEQATTRAEAAEAALRELQAERDALIADLRSHDLAIDNALAVLRAAGVQFLCTLSSGKAVKLRVALGGSDDPMHFNIVASWCAENPRQAAMIVGAVALAKLAVEGP